MITSLLVVSISVYHPIYNGPYYYYLTSELSNRKCIGLVNGALSPKSTKYWDLMFGDQLTAQSLMSLISKLRMMTTVF